MTSTNTLETMVHPAQALRSARSRFPTACFARTTHQGHPMWRLVHQLRSTQLHRTTQLHALSMESATSVVKQAITLVSAPRTSTKSRMLHHVPEATTTTTVASLPRRSSPPNPLLPRLVVV